MLGSVKRGEGARGREGCEEQRAGRWLEADMSIRGENSIELMGEEDACTRRENEINQKQGLTIACFLHAWSGGRHLMPYPPIA